MDKDILMDSTARKVISVIEPQTVMEGAGVKLKRSIATATLDNLDPFLLFDHFGSKDPTDYIKGFPMHPHRGIETVTYMIQGVVNHKDSMGNAGSITSGDVQWMTAGGGIMHEEMPQAGRDEMIGFQLWVNLPAKLKLCNPRYQNIFADQIPQVTRADGVKIKIIAGEVDDVRGPVTEIAADPIYLDITVPPNVVFKHRVESDHTAFAYVFEGAGRFGSDTAEKEINYLRLLEFSDGNYVEARATDQHVRFLLVAGKPLNEPIARHGPFVMNTQDEIQQALEDLRNGTFVKN
jgi:redox-sensitive bicupin YhaK (pirin superfamily)